jgi:hypothetical protein
MSLTNATQAPVLQLSADYQAVRAAKRKAVDDDALSEYATDVAMHSKMDVEEQTVVLQSRRNSEKSAHKAKVLELRYLDLALDFVDPAKELVCHYYNTRHTRCGFSGLYRIPELDLVAHHRAFICRKHRNMCDKDAALLEAQIVFVTKLVDVLDRRAQAAPVVQPAVIPAAVVPAPAHDPIVEVGDAELARIREDNALVQRIMNDPTFVTTVLEAQ